MFYKIVSVLVCVRNVTAKRVIDQTKQMFETRNFSVSKKLRECSEAPKELKNSESRTRKNSILKFKHTTFIYN
jgi:hypothetical protein